MPDAGMILDSDARFIELGTLVMDKAAKSSDIEYKTSKKQDQSRQASVWKVAR